MHAWTNRKGLAGFVALLTACVPAAPPHDGSAGAGQVGDSGAGADPEGQGLGGASGVGGTGGTGGTGAGGDTSGDAGTPLDGGMVSCPIPCAAPASICDPETLSCVQCLDQPHCPSPAASRCNTLTHVCEPCRPNNVTDCDGVVVDGQAREICLQGLCLGCIEDTDCGAEAPVCENNLCVACETDPQCDHIADRPMCVDGRCVQCEETSDCAAVDEPGVCDVRGGACAAALPEETPLCGACVSTDQCDEGVCARMPTEPPGDDYRCMPLADAATDCDETARQFRVRALTVTVEAKNVAACVPALLDCALLDRQGATCGADPDCGDRALCEGTCAIACEVDRDCDDDLFCKAGAGGEHCRP